MPLKGSVLFSSLVSWGHMCAPPFMLNYYYSSIFKFYRCFLNVSYCCFTFSVVMNIQITLKMTILLYLNAEKMFSFVSGVQSRKAVRTGCTVDDLIWSCTTYVLKLPVGTLIYLPERNIFVCLRKWRCMIQKTREIHSHSSCLCQ